MPTYTVNIPGQGDFTIDSPNELTNEEAAAAALQSMAAPAEGSQAQPSIEMGERQPGSGYFERVGRRLGEAGEAAMDIPSSMLGVVTGGETSRFENILRLLQGIGAPASAILSPVSSAVEHGAEAIMSPEAAASVGSLSEIPASFGVGALATLGKLGKYGRLVSRATGMGGRPRTLEEQLKHDPHLRSVLLEKGPRPTSGIDTIEQLARTEGASIEEIAIASKSPSLAEALLNQKTAANHTWGKFAKDNAIITAIPPEPRYTHKKIMEFQPAAKDRDATLLTTLGTPATRIRALSQEAGIAQDQINLTEMNIKRAFDVRHERTVKAVMGVGDKDARDGVIAFQSSQTLQEVMAISPTKVSLGAKNLFKFFDDKFEVDRKIAIPRLREMYRPSIQRQVTDQLRKGIDPSSPNWILSKAAVDSEVSRRLAKEIPDTLRYTDNPSLFFPGRYKVMVEGRHISTHSSPIEAKLKIYELAQAGEDAHRLSIDSRTFFDSDTLHLLKSNRLSKVMESLAKHGGIDKKQVLAAAKGDFFNLGDNAGGKWLAAFFNKAGLGGDRVSYTNDLIQAMDMYDKQFEKWLQLSELKRKVNPVINSLRNRGLTRLSEIVEGSIEALQGKRFPLGSYLDNMIAGTPILRDFVAPYALERLGGGTKLAMVNLFLRWNPRYHALNSTQTAATLWPIADAKDIIQGGKLWRSKVGDEILKRHGVTEPGSVIEGFAKRIGPEETMNQQVAFLTMYNNARKWGLSDQQAGNYGKLRGVLYSQFLGLTTDMPVAFRKLDPLGFVTMFQRFPIKQIEMVADLVKDRNFAGGAKWLAVNLLLGGFKAATLGTSGWLTLEAYQKIKKEFGEPTADLFHLGLPSLIGVDISSSVMLYNPPFGETWKEQLGNMLAGPVGGVTSSIVGSAINQAGPEPSAAKRAFNAFVRQVPLARQLDGIRRIIEGDYDFKDPMGRLKYQAETKDVIKTILGARSEKEALIDTTVKALFEMRQRRDSVLNYAASRYGQAQLAGVSLGQEMQGAIQKDVDAWNALWPEFPITGSELAERASARRRVATQTLQERLLRSAPKALRQSETFRLPGGGG